MLLLSLLIIAMGSAVDCFFFCSRFHQAFTWSYVKSKSFFFQPHFCAPSSSHVFSLQILGQVMSFIIWKYIMELLCMKSSNLALSNLTGLAGLQTGMRENAQIQVWRTRSIREHSRVTKSIISGTELQHCRLYRETLEVVNFTLQKIRTRLTAGHKTYKERILLVKIKSIINTGLPYCDTWLLGM